MGAEELARYTAGNLCLPAGSLESIVRVVVRLDLTHRQLLRTPALRHHVSVLGRVGALVERGGERELHLAAPEGPLRAESFRLQHALLAALRPTIPPFQVRGSVDDTVRLVDGWADRVAGAVAGAPIALCLHGELNLRHAWLTPTQRRTLAEELGLTGVGAAALGEAAFSRWRSAPEPVEAAYRRLLPGSRRVDDPLLAFAILPGTVGPVVATGYTAGDQAARMVDALQRRLPLREVLLHGSCGGLVPPRPSPCLVVATEAAGRTLPLAADLRRIAVELGHAAVCGPVLTVRTPAEETRSMLQDSGAVGVDCELGWLAAVCEAPLGAIFAASDWPLAGSHPGTVGADTTGLHAAAAVIAAHLAPWSG